MKVPLPQYEKISYAVRTQCLTHAQKKLNPNPQENAKWKTSFFVQSHAHSSDFCFCLLANFIMKVLMRIK